MLNRMSGVRSPPPQLYMANEIPDDSFERWRGHEWEMESKYIKPTLIHSKILNETIYLTDIPIPGMTCYSPKEIEFLKTATQAMEEEEYAIYLRKVHLVKKAFPDSKIEDVKMEAPAGEDVAGKSFRGESPEPGVEGTEATPGPPTQKSLWED